MVYMATEDNVSVAPGVGNRLLGGERMVDGSADSRVWGERRRAGLQVAMLLKGRGR